MTTEEWRSVVGFPAYQISSQGRVRSSHNWRGQRDRLLGGAMTRKGYPFVQLIAPDGRVRSRSRHILLAEAFIGPRPPGHHVRHLDGNAKNCTIGNLAYGTPAENTADQLRHGTHPNASKTKCARGHLFDEQNTRFRPDGSRRCATCRREDSRRQRERRAFRAAGLAA